MRGWSLPLLRAVLYAVGWLNAVPFADGMRGARIGAAAAFAQAPRARRYTPKEGRDLGALIVRRKIEQYGQVTNRAWQDRVADVLSRLRDGAAYPELELKPVLVGNDAVDAGALSGGFIVVNAGLMRFVDSLGVVDAPGDSARARVRADGYLAAVLGHELAHITLAHTDQILDDVRRALSPPDRAAAVRDPGVYERELRLKPSLLRARRMDQKTELAADSLGALYLLRSGWEIQDALGFLRHMEDLERLNARLADAPSYVRDHPRAATREAILEGLRARLKLNQGRLDDALFSVNHNAELDLAIALLDSVIRDFPTLLAARHARGAAFHRKWLNSMPVQAQIVRSSLFTFGAHFLPSIRGAPGDTTSLLRAQQEYEAVLAADSLPGTLANLAILDAYSGRRAVALRRAERAGALAPDEPQIRNNLGVVRFLTGDVKGAEAEFRRALEAQGAREDPAVVFNLGKTQTLLHDSAARATFEAYLQLDSASAWSAVAKRLLGRLPEVATPTSAPPPPVVAGITLGLPGDSVVRALGPPDSVRDWPRGAIWRYAAKGLTLFVGSHQGVTALQLDTSEAGDIDGVRVGDSIQVARRRWGWPSERQDRFLIYGRAGWMIGVRLGDPNGRILRLEIAAAG